MKKVATVALLALLAAALPAEDIRVVVPYVGAVTSVYENDTYGVDVDGTGLMTGLYLQWINPDLFQANGFLYYAPDVLDAPVIGGHLVGDYYVWSNALGKLAVGAGLEVLQPGVSTEVMPGPTQIDATPTIWAPYARAGHYFYFGSRDQVLLSVFPWAGVEYDITRGDLTIDPPGPGSIELSTDDETWFGLAGVSVSATIMHFIELQAKYKLTFNEDDLLSSFDAMANVFFTRHWGVSYRFKYMQNTSGPMSYHIGGIAYVF